MNISLFNITDLCLQPLLVVHWLVDNKQSILQDSQNPSSEPTALASLPSPQWARQDLRQVSDPRDQPLTTLKCKLWSSLLLQGLGGASFFVISRYGSIAQAVPGPLPGSLTQRRLGLQGGLKVHPLMSQVLTKDYTYTPVWLEAPGQRDRPVLTFLRTLRWPPVVSLPGKSTQA